MYDSETYGGPRRGQCTFPVSTISNHVRGHVGTDPMIPVLFLVGRSPGRPESRTPGVDSHLQRSSYWLQNSEDRNLVP